MLLEDIKALETINKYSDRCEEARTNITKSLDKSGTMSLAGIEKVAKVKVSELLTKEQMDELVLKILEYLEKNEQESKEYLSSISMPSHPAFLDDVLPQPKNKTSENIVKNESVDHECESEEGAVTSIEVAS